MFRDFLIQNRAKQGYEAAYENINKEKLIWTNPTLINRLKSLDRHDPGALISSNSFIAWIKTKEGNRYWSGIFDLWFEKTHNYYIDFRQ